MSQFWSQLAAAAKSKWVHVAIVGAAAAAPAMFAAAGAQEPLWVTMLCAAIASGATSHAVASSGVKA